MTTDEFKGQVQEAVNIYLTDYFSPPAIEWDFEDDGDPRAYITVKPGRGEEAYQITVSINQEGEPGVESGEDCWLSLDDAGFMTRLFFEAHERVLAGRNL